MNENEKQAIFKRLAGEKEQKINRLKELGRKSAAEWVKTADYESLAAVGEWEEPNPMAIDMDSMWDTIPESLSDELEEDGEFFEVNNLRPELRDAWLEGWLDTAYKFFEDFERFENA